MTRWLKFSAVGLVGVGVQLLALELLLRLHVHYLLATGLAVEAALLHNYAWHRAWTWSDRPGGKANLLRFHVANGLVSIASNVFWMRLLTGWLHVPPLAANLLAIAATSALNFTLGHRWVFQAEPAAKTGLSG